VKARGPTWPSSSADMTIIINEEYDSSAYNLSRLCGKSVKKLWKMRRAAGPLVLFHGVPARNRSKIQAVRHRRTAHCGTLRASPAIGPDAHRQGRGSAGHATLLCPRTPRQGDRGDGARPGRRRPGVDLQGGCAVWSRVPAPLLMGTARWSPKLRSPCAGRTTGAETSAANEVTGCACTRARPRAHLIGMRWCAGVAHERRSPMCCSPSRAPWVDIWCVRTARGRLRWTERGGRNDTCAAHSAARVLQG
jgi:hypothetical protein